MTIDFHVHTEASFDCFLGLERMVELARKSGLDGLAIADHNTIEAAAAVREMAPDLYIIAAEEISTPLGDILGLFLKQEIRPCRDARAVIREIRAQGGLAVLAHPYKWPHLLRPDGDLKLFDAIEVFNARNNIPLPYLENAFSRASLRRLGFPVIAGSDTHEGFELGRARTVFDFSPSEADDEMIKRAILERRVKVEGQEVSLGLEVVSHFSRNIRGLFPR